MPRFALTLPGGGARAAYQAGALRAIAEICQFKESPFTIISGVSAGGINGMWLAADSDNFATATTALWERWKALEVGDIYKTDPMTLLQTGATLFRNLSFGEWFGRSHITYLLDTSPLAQLLHASLDFASIEKNLAQGRLYALSLTATDYHTGKAVTFFAGDASIQPWKNSLSRGQREAITVKHVMASAAIPVFFPPIRLGDRDYGDGGVGLKSPLSPAIHLGADRLMVIGVQNPVMEDTGKATSTPHAATLGDIAGVLLNSMFLSSLDADIERLQKINHTVSTLTPEQLREPPNGIRHIDVLAIRPSRDLSCLGVREFAQFPFAVRHMLKGLGVNDRKGWDLLSYLAFDQVYSAALLELGYSDTRAMRTEIETFFKV